MTSDRIEYQKDFSALLDLYHELGDRYRTSGLEDKDFEIDYLDEFSWINKFIERWKKAELIRMSRGDIDSAVDELVSMEKSLCDII